MGIAFTKRIGTDGILSLWQITETVDQLKEGLITTELEELLTKTQFSEKRKREWLATRQLLAQMLAIPEKISYREDGKPYLESKNYQISISHSVDYGAIYLSKNKDVGVDIQKIRASVLKGADFFINEQEMSWAENTDVVVKNLIWSAKESVFKFSGNSKTDLKRDIEISPFLAEQFGEMQAYILNQNELITVAIGYDIIGDYVLTWTM